MKIDQKSSVEFFIDKKNDIMLKRKLINENSCIYLALGYFYDIMFKLGTIDLEIANIIKDIEQDIIYSKNIDIEKYYFHLNPNTIYRVEGIYPDFVNLKSPEYEKCEHLIGSSLYLLYYTFYSYNDDTRLNIINCMKEMHLLMNEDMFSNSTSFNDVISKFNKTYKKTVLSVDD